MEYSGLTRIVLEPGDIGMLHEALLEWCREKRCDVDSYEARTAAKELILWFDFGIRDREKLIQIIRCL